MRYLIILLMCLGVCGCVWGDLPDDYSAENEVYLDMSKFQIWTPSTDFSFSKETYEDIDWIEYTDDYIIIHMKLKDDLPN